MRRNWALEQRPENHIKLLLVRQVTFTKQYTDKHFLNLQGGFTTPKSSEQEHFLEELRMKSATVALWKSHLLCK